MDSSSEPQFSFVFEPRRPLLNEFLRPLLENLQVSLRRDETTKLSPSTHLWINFPGEVVDQAIKDAGLDRHVLLQQGSFPTAHVPLTADLKAAIQSVCIYEPHGDKVYLQLESTGSLRMKYQQILGGQKLSEDNPDFLKKMTERLAGILKNGPDFVNPVERFRVSPDTGRGEIVQNGQRISALLSDISSVLDGVGESLKPKATSPVDKAPVIARALSARAAVGGRSSNASEAVLADLAKLFVDPANPQHLSLPKDHLQNYAKVKALVTTAGGKYNSKGFFSFPEGIDPAGVQQTLLGGVVVNDKKDFQFFATPRSEALDLCDRAGPLEGKRVLEPSAGDGALADIARDRGADVVVVENWGVNVSKLKSKGYDVIEKDFLQVTPEDIGLFDVILANPPFSKNQDIDHVRHMMNFLKPGGVLSVITSQAWERGSQKKQLAFAEFLKEIGAEIIPVSAGAFKESGTDVPTFKIVIEKPPAPDLEAKSRSIGARP